jgi:hypothetical protein
MNKPAILRTVHVRVNDAVSGQPTPVRLRLSDPAGNYYAPFGRLADFLTARGEDVGGNLLWDGKQYAYIDGTCEVRLPAGPLLVEVRKGPEFETLRSEINLGAGQMALRLAMTRRHDLRAAGWYAGDIRAHYLSPHGALLEGAAEDLAFVNLLALEDDWPRGISNILAFSGQTPALAMPGCQVIVNSLNRHPTLGALGLLNCHRVVFPLSFGGGDAFDDWSLADWCGQCHRKGGLVVWSAFFESRAPNLLRGEAPADVILGKIDALEITDVFSEDWYTFLNAGCWLPLAGGSGKMTNREVLGTFRTYAQLQGEEPTYKNWIEAIRAGRTFATCGPLLEFAVNGQGPGATIDLDSAEQKIQVRLSAGSEDEPGLLEIVANGEVREVSGGEMELCLPQGGWVAARCRERTSGRVLAHTSPVFVQVQGRPRAAEVEAIAKLNAHLDSMLAWVEHVARCATEAPRAHLRDIFSTAQKALHARSG